MNSARFARWIARTEHQLDMCLPSASQVPQRLHAAMRHAALGSGKRIRPLLVYATGTLFGAEEATLDPPALAVELMHAYSLVHDDLPAMDNDALRRGQPTVHVAFDQGTAILAGDALQTHAFMLLATAPASAARRLAWLQSLARSAGAAGMCGGQALDMDATGSPQSLEALQTMHALKTGALIRAAVGMGALTGEACLAERQRLDGFASNLGLAFQIRDDILDVESNARTLGKNVGKDAAQVKSTYATVLGLDGAKAKLTVLAAQMQDALKPYDGRADALAELARFAVDRSH